MKLLLLLGLMIILVAIYLLERKISRIMEQSVWDAYGKGPRPPEKE